MVKIYDGAQDDYREVTQDDVDRLMTTADFLGAERDLLRKICSRANQTGPDVDWMKQRIKWMRSCIDGFPA